MKWVKISERLPDKDGLYLVVHNPPSGRFRNEMFFKKEDGKWYWQPNPYSVCVNAFIYEWLDESAASELEAKDKAIREALGILENKKPDTPGMGAVINILKQSIQQP